MPQKLIDLIDVTSNQLFENKPAQIEIELKNKRMINISYSGQFADLVGLSFDMISGLISNYEDISYFFSKKL